MATLEDYALKSLHLAKMTGIMLGVHAIKDGFLLMHSGVGCKYKTASQISQHDWATHPNKKEGWTQVGDRAVIKGSSARIAPFARSWYERREPGFMAMVTAVFLELTGEDFSDSGRKAEEEGLPCPLAVIGTGGAVSDMFAGYGSMLVEVARRFDWAQEERRAGEVAIMGHFFSRYESDQKADLQQIKSLLKAIGLELGATLFSGTNYEDLTRAPGAEHLLEFPYARPVRKKLKRVTKREAIPVSLPMGIRGTSRWLREVAQATGADMDKTEAYIGAQMRKTRGQIGKLRDRYAGMPVAVFADTPLAAGLISMLDDFGLRPVLVGLRDQSLGQHKVLDPWLEADGVQLPDGAEVLLRPSLRLLRERLTEMIERREIVGIFASSTELNLFQSMQPMGFRPFLIEVGFPTNKYHVTYSIPMLGYGGVVAMAQRILDKFLSGM